MLIPDNFNKINIPNKRIGDQLPHTEFNMIVQTLKGDTQYGIIPQDLIVKNRFYVLSNSNSNKALMQVESETINLLASTTNIQGKCVANTLEAKTIKCSNNATLSNTSINGTLSTSGKLTCQNALEVKGNTTFKGAVDVDGAITFKGGTTFTGNNAVNFGVNGIKTQKIQASDSANPIVITDKVTFSSNVTIDGTLSGNAINQIQTAINNNSYDDSTISNQISAISTSLNTLSQNALQIGDLNTKLGWVESGNNQHKFKIGDNYYTLQEALTAIVAMFSQYSKTNHTHDGYATTDHTHDDKYAALNHTHDGYATTDHTHDDKYAALNHTHDGFYAPVYHTHDGVYAPVSHTHNGYATSNDITSAINAHVNEYNHYR